MAKFITPLLFLFVAIGLPFTLSAEEKKGLEIGRTYLVLDVMGRAIQGKLIALDKATITIAGKGAKTYKIDKDDIEAIKEVPPTGRIALLIQSAGSS